MSLPVRAYVAHMRAQAGDRSTTGFRSHLNSRKLWSCLTSSPNSHFTDSSGSQPWASSKLGFLLLPSYSISPSPLSPLLPPPSPTPLPACPPSFLLFFLLHASNRHLGAASTQDWLLHECTRKSRLRCGLQRSSAGLFDLLSPVKVAVTFQGQGNPECKMGFM